MLRGTSLLFLASSTERKRPHKDGMWPSFAALLTFALMALPTQTSGATFFYGATEDDGLDAGEFDGEHALALAETAALSDEGDEHKLSAQELQSVYQFCELLPQLRQGQTAQNRGAREVCAKLVAMLKPMFKRQSRTMRFRRPGIKRAAVVKRAAILHPEDYFFY